ncbi:Gfo/Idh/MocA family protein [Dactylosporangium sp. CA-092794]|uniref:Gfo/Idh/MocA family protein n=1 Tax=Dactylosporangium sp. CA-092794 TaxID=3239929 RepID=UPI003D92297B
MKPFSYAVVGTGWRSGVFLKLARLLPGTLRITSVVSRTAERGAEVEAEWGVPTDRTLAAAVARERPDFVVISVPRTVAPGVAREAVGLGLPVLCETPPALDVDGMLSLWSSVGASGLVQVAEQYLLLPGHAARLALIRDGALGTVSNVQVSSTHQYHAVSIIRHMLGAGFADAEVTARRSTFPLADPMHRSGWSDDVTPKRMGNTLAQFDFGDDRTGLYDFTDNQWHNPLRGSRIVVRGSTGELVDDHLVQLRDPRTVVESDLVRRQTGLDMNLEGFDLDHISLGGAVLFRNPWQGARLADDEIAVASLLERTGAWARDGAPPPYPLAEACQDHLLALAVEESLVAGATVRTARRPWAEG